MESPFSALGPVDGPSGVKLYRNRGQVPSPTENLVSAPSGHEAKWGDPGGPPHCSPDVVAVARAVAYFFGYCVEEH